ncbi:MAG: hypothetical protein CMP67_11250 [Flavobacteriales bacterium]|nr:hypothetical protein [Flavobacteriales bacterium]|tara:strand:+ start:1431 stop:2384 length:954 start_codon:yes stop_codon:yes gene_type:complete
MKKQLLLISFSMLFSVMLTKAQTADLIFLNSNSASEASSLDVKVKKDGVVVASFSNVNFLDASTKISVPASAILNIDFLVAGSSTVFYSLTNEVYDPNTFKVMHLFGTKYSKRFKSFTAASQSSSSNVVKLDFTYSTDGTEDIDLKIRENSTTIADNFQYGEQTFTFDDEYSATNVTLDITEHATGNGLHAYNFPAGSLGGDYVYLFTSGTDMYMLEMNGTTTKLTTTTPINSSSVSENDSKDWLLFPNPASNFINLQSKNAIVDYKIEIINSTGKVVRTSFATDKIDISDLSKGFYYISASNSAGNLATFKFLKTK